MELATSARNPKKENVDLWKRMELGLIPDEEIRDLMKIGLEKRLKWGYKQTHEQQLSQLLHFAKSLRSMKMASEMETLDDQMYETPTAFQQVMCGSTIKESAGFFKDESTTLDEAEIKMLDLYCEKARIEDGQRILDLGCGHGAVMLHIAQKYKNCNVTGVTNSISQQQFIIQRCKELNLSNVNMILADVTMLEMDATYDRVFIIGLIEHMKNFELFLRKISKWITKDGLLFLEHYCHKTFAYPCEPVDEDDWYTMFIFPPGTLILPSASFLLYFQDDLIVVDRWTLNGNHYARTQEEWLKRIDANVDAVKQMFESVCGGNKEEAVKLMNFWRIFCITGAEMLAYNNGEEWMISHYLFEKRNWSMGVMSSLIFGLPSKVSFLLGASSRPKVPD